MNQNPHWREIQRQSFTSAEKLADFLELSQKHRKKILNRPRFPLLLPKRLAEKIEKNNPSDPILRQFIPTEEEIKKREGFCLDPVQDEQFRLTKRLLKKYSGRALLVCTQACAMHCRYCFRQHFQYDDQPIDFSEELECIANDSTIQEIILSGGDPLSLSDEHLKKLMLDLSSIPHIRRIRFHSRFPIGIPERIDDSFLSILEETPMQIWFVIHCNHPKELDEEVLRRLKKIQKLGIPVLNQAVLLKGVNDDANTLQLLCEILIDHGISPYYLHQLDRVAGAGHFEVDTGEGKKLIKAIQTTLPGYAMQQYVQEIPGEKSKISL